jgi:two-component system, cell cycle sensor histidine kinase and response regulator CckA
MVSAAIQHQAVTATKILIVEDEGIIAGHIASRLVRTGYEVSGIAESSEEALAKVAELNPELILMDIRIKGSMDGIETTAKLREHYDIPVIYLTAHTDQQTIDRAKVTGAFGFLTKPIHHTSLATAIEMAIHKHRADRAARHHRAWMATVLNTMADAMLVLDRDRKIQFLNGPAEKLTGWTNQEALEMDVSQILPLEQGPSPEDSVTVKRLESGEILFPAFDGRSPCRIPRGLMAGKRSGLCFPIEGEIAPCIDGGIVVGAVITFRDATARQAEEEELRHQHKMEAVGRLAAGIAHDFNNLLFLILGYTEEIMRTSTLTERDVKALTEIRKAGDNATNITQQLLKFSRKEAIQKQDLNLNEVIRDTEELFRRMSGVSVKWSFRLDPNLGLVRGDIGQLKQVLMNLAANARDAMPDGGKVTIETTNVDVPRANYSGNVRDTFIALTVTDTGIGMTPDTAEHLFEPFFTTKEPGSGTGLGLSIVHSVVTDHGGTIHVDAEPGHGAAFTLYFPRVAEGAGTAPVGITASREDSHSRTILLVDDQKDVRRLLLTYLEDSGCRILEAENGEDAIRIAREYPGTIDLLITDVVMPKANGFEVARKLVGQKGITHTIFISGYAQDLVNGLESLPAGARFLPKPFAKRDFLQNVSDLLSQKSTLTMTSGA